MLPWGGSNHHAQCDLESLVVRAAQSGVEWDPQAGHLGGLGPKASGCSESPGAPRPGAFSLDLENLSDAGGLVTYPAGSLDSITAGTEHSVLSTLLPSSPLVDGHPAVQGKPQMHMDFLSCTEAVWLGCHIPGGGWGRGDREVLSPEEREQLGSEL